MVGGTVVETITVEEKGKIWINCKDDKTKENCAIYVEDCAAARCIEPEDSVWWQADKAYWSPRSRAFRDYELKRIGTSGVRRPSKAK